MPYSDISMAKLAAGILGAVVSLRFVQGSFSERISMCIGGAALSYYAATPAAVWVGLPNAEGLVGFLIGLFGMAVASKAYEAIQATSAGDLIEAIKRKWSA